jgi:copper chaperone
MTIKLKVPSIACEVCANTITNAIKNQISNAEISVDVTTKIVTVTKENITEDQLKEIIIEAGHVIE